MDYIKNGDLSFEEFCDSIRNINLAESEKGIIYSSIQIIGDKVYGIRESTNVPFSISLPKLYFAYINVPRINTSTLKPYVDRVQSPSLAILKACGAVAPSVGNPDISQIFVENNRVKKRSSTKQESKTPTGSMEFITKFFIIAILAGIIIYNLVKSVR